MADPASLLGSVESNIKILDSRLRNLKTIVEGCLVESDALVQSSTALAEVGNYIPDKIS